MKNKSFLSSMKSTFRILKVVYDLCPYYIYAILARGIIHSILPFINLIFSYLILDALIQASGFQEVMKLVLALISLNLILGLIRHFLNYVIAKQNVLLDCNLSNQIALKSFELDYEQIEDIHIKNLITKAQDGSNSSGGLSSYCENSIANVLNYLLQIIYAIVLLSGLFVMKSIDSDSPIIRVINHPLSILFILVVITSSTVISTLISTKINRLGYEAMLKNVDGNRKFSYLYSICSNYIYGKDLRIYAMQDMLVDIMTDKKHSVDSNWRSFSIKSMKFNILINFMNKILLFSSYIYVGLKAYYGFITIGNVVSYVGAITILSTAINQLLSNYVQVLQQNTYLENYFIFLGLETKMKYGKKNLELKEIEIEFKGVSFKYPGQNEYILHDINFKIEKNQKVAIVGENGAGKTTLIKLLCRLYEPTSGVILINGIPIEDFSRDSLYNLFAIVFQDFKLFSYTILENLTCGEKNADLEKVWDALDRAGVKDRVERMELKLNTILYQNNTEAGVEISGGESQKIAIARTLYKDAPIVILDEPTSALDPKSEAEIYEKFHELVSDKTSVFISHRMSSCKFCDEIIVLEKGKIVQKNCHSVLLQDLEGLYCKMWSAQSKYYQ